MIVRLLLAALGVLQIAVVASEQHFTGSIN
jgi:hypothetical protein